MLALRFDVDTRAGLVERVPPLLDLLDRHGLPATFFVVMGREANLLEIVRLRLLAPRTAKSPLNVAAKGGPLKILQAALLPRAVGSGNPDLLREVVARGHELQPHGWSHIRWQRSLPAVDVAEHLDRARAALQSVTGVAPQGWASPGRSCDERVLSVLDERGLLYGADLDGRLPFVPPSHRHLQLPVSLFETIAQMRARGLGDDDVVATYLRVVEDNPDYCCLYEHPDDLGPAELRLFDRVFTEVVRSGREVVALSEVARRVAAGGPPRAQG